MTRLHATAAFALTVLAHARRARGFQVGRSSPSASTRSRPHLRRRLPLPAVASAPAGDDGDAATSVATKRRRPRPRRGKRRHDTKRPAAASSGGAQTWRLFGVEVHPDALGRDAVSPTEQRRGAPRAGNSAPPPEKAYLTGPVLAALTSKLRLERDDASLPCELQDARVVRRSLDARKRRVGEGSPGPRYVYVIDVDVSASTARRLRWKHRPGKMELLPPSPRPLAAQSQPVSAQNSLPKSAFFGSTHMQTTGECDRCGQVQSGAFMLDLQ